MLEPKTTTEQQDQPTETDRLQRLNPDLDGLDDFEDVEDIER